MLLSQPPLAYKFMLSLGYRTDLTVGEWATKELTTYGRRPSVDFRETEIPDGFVLKSKVTDDKVTVANNQEIRFEELDSTSLTATTREMLYLDYDVPPAIFRLQYLDAGLQESS